MENELIIVNGELSKDFTDEYIEFLKYKKMVDAKEEDFKNRLKEAMRENNVYKLANDRISIAYTPETTREDFDKKRFKEENPDLFDNYLKITKVSGSLRITVKEEKNG